MIRLRLITYSTTCIFSIISKIYTTTFHILKMQDIDNFTCALHTVQGYKVRSNDWQRETRCCHEHDLPIQSQLQHIHTSCPYLYPTCRPCFRIPWERMWANSMVCRVLKRKWGFAFLLQIKNRMFYWVLVGDFGDLKWIGQLCEMCACGGGDEPLARCVRNTGWQLLSKLCSALLVYLCNTAEDANTQICQSVKNLCHGTVENAEVNR